MGTGTGGLEPKDSVLLLIDAALAARTFYCFMRQYFVSRIAVPPPEQTATNKDGEETESLSQTDLEIKKANRRKPVRVYMDGCFDSMHFGHANALRQAKALGDVLVVGINPESEIRIHKGPPIMSDEERRVAVEGVKWVDEILVNVPYVVTPQFLDELIHKHDIDIIVHGDDPCIGADGQDVYAAVKRMGRFRTVKRTEGVSSTDIVERMLTCTSDHHLASESTPSSSSIGPSTTVSANGTASAQIRASAFLPTTRRLLQFAGKSARAPRAGDRVVYVDGTFDMFHAGHVMFLEQAASLGDFLLVGLHDDHTVNARRGGNLPIMNLHERTLSVLACRHVDEVIIGAPWAVSQDMITTMNISVVVHGTLRASDTSPDSDAERYAVPKSARIFKQLKSTSDLTVDEILHRVRRNRDAFVRRNVKKTASEAEYLTLHKRYIAEH